MLKINFEFRKGIFFLRLIGDMNKKTYQEKEQELSYLLIENKFKYIVINVNDLNSIDMTGINYINKIYYLTIKNKSNLVLCDKFKLLSSILKKNIPSINDEIEVL